MNTIFHKIAMSSCLLLSCLLLSAQQVASVNIRKGIEEIRKKPRLEVEIHVPMDMTGFEIDNPIDFERSKLEIFADDTGKDFLAAFVEKQQEQENQGYSQNEHIFSFGGVADYASGNDFMMVFTVPTDPAPAARTIHLKGNVVVNFINEGEALTAIIEDVPVEMPYNSPGHSSKIGPIRIEGRGSATIGDNKYRKFAAMGVDSPITTVEVVGGDDSEAVKGIWGSSDNTFVFSVVPETVDLKITYSTLKKKDVPIDLEFGIGL